MDTLLEELIRIEKKFDIYFSDPVNSDLKPKDFMVSRKFLTDSSGKSIKLKHFNKLLINNEDVEFMEGVLGNKESDKINKIQQFFVFKQAQKKINLFITCIHLKNFQDMDCE